MSVIVLPLRMMGSQGISIPYVSGTAEVFNSSSNFAAVMERTPGGNDTPLTSTSNGFWVYDSGGSSGSGGTGPGNNNELAFIHTETTGGTSISAMETNGLIYIKASKIPNAQSRRLHLRLAIMGDFESGDEGLEIQTIDTSTTPHTTNTTLITGWDYNNNYTVGDPKISISTGAAISGTSCVVKGGWFDHIVTMTDATDRIALQPRYTYAEPEDEPHNRGDHHFLCEYSVTVSSPLSRLHRLWTA